MYLQKKNYHIYLAITIIFLVVFITSSIGFYCTDLFGVSIVSQLSLSIFTGAILVALASYITYRHERVVFVNTVSCEMRLLFDDVDEYLKTIDAQENYIETYFEFRRKFLSIQSALFYEVLNEGDNKINSIIQQYGQAFGNIRLLLYHSYFAVKTLDITRNNDSNFLSVKGAIPTQVIKQILDETLAPLHSALRTLANDNSLNIWAKELRDIVGISISVNLQSQDASYQSPSFWLKDK